MQRAGSKRKTHCCATSLFVMILAACGGGGSDDGGGIIIVPAPNENPVAEAGDDFDAVEHESVTLQSTSSDPDGMLTAWLWEQTGGPEVTLADAGTEAASFTAPGTSDAVTLEFTLTVTDDRGGTDSDVVQVSIHPDEPPELAVHFPCAGCRVSGAAVSVSGTVTSGPDTGHTAEVDGVDSVIVDAGAGSVEAQVDTDGRWTAQNVPLPPDATQVSLSVTATDLFGESANAVLDMEHGPTLATALVGFDPVTAERGYILDQGAGTHRLFGIDFTTHLLTEIHEFDASELAQVTDVEIDDGAGRLFVNQLPDAIGVIDLATGALSILADADTGSGPDLQRPLRLAFDTDDQRLVVYDDLQKALFTVDVATGARDIVSDNVDQGSGAPFAQPTALTIDSAHDVAYLGEPPGELIAVDLASGARSTLSTTGEPLAAVRAMAFDAPRSVLVLFDEFDRVTLVDLATGNHTPLSEGAGLPEFEIGNVPVQLLYDALGDRYVISDFGANVTDTDKFVAVDPESGNRSLLFDNHHGSGAVAYGGVHLALDADGAQIYLAADASARVLRVDLETGDRQLVSDENTGTGAAIGTPGDIVLDAAVNRALVLDGQNAALLAVALDSGDRTTITSGSIGSGPKLVSPTALAADLARDRVFVLDPGVPAIFVVDLGTGERTIVSDASNSGPALVSFFGAVLDSENQRLIVAENGDGSTAQTAIVAVDLVTGHRKIISGFDTGSGPFLNLLLGVAWADEPDSVIVSAFERFYLVDLATGDRQAIADGDVGNGEDPFNVNDVVFDPGKRVFYSWDFDYEAFFQYDLATGDRVTVSR